MSQPELSWDGAMHTVRVPFTMRKRGGRKRVVAPDGAAWVGSRPRVDHTMVKALARAFRRKSILEVGRIPSLATLAEHEKI